MILEESPEGFGFGKAGFEAAKKYKFAPVLVDGKPVEITGVKSKIIFEIAN